jgi:hypothetical protein
MEFCGFTLYPSSARRLIAELDEQRVVGQILERADLIRYLPSHKKLRVNLENPIAIGASLADAHGEWTEDYFPRVETLNPFPRQPQGTACPPGLVRVSVECINRETPGMSSHFGFNGYFLSLLISLPEGRIWDARGEPAP